MFDVILLDTNILVYADQEDDHDVTRIYTYNTSDFIPFSDEIEVLTPPVDDNT